MYKAITRNGNTVFYYNEQLIFKAVTWKCFCYYRFYIEDRNNVKLLKISIVGLFGFFKRYSIIEQNLPQHIELLKCKNNLTLKLKDEIISISKKRHLVKFEGNFVLNDEKFGVFYNQLTMFESSFTFDFEKIDETNLYFLILFSILVIDEFNFGISA